MIPFVYYHQESSTSASPEGKIAPPGGKEEALVVALNGLGFRVGFKEVIWGYIGDI